MIDDKIKARLGRIKNSDTRAIAISYEQALRFKAYCENRPDELPQAESIMLSAEIALNDLISNRAMLWEVHAISDFIHTLKKLSDDELKAYGREHPQLAVSDLVAGDDNASGSKEQQGAVE